MATGTYSSYYDRFATAFLANLGAPDSGANHAAVVAWIGGEAGWSGTNTAVTHNNPLNIKTSSFTSYGIHPPSANYIVDATTHKNEAYGSFASPEAGAAATAAYIKAGASDHHYDVPIAALKNNDGVGFLNGIAKSDWAGGHYGLLKGHNSLLDNLSYVLGAKVIDTGSLSKGTAGIPTDLQTILNKKPTDTVTAADVDTIAKWAADKNPASGADPTGTIRRTLENTVHRLFDPFVGKTWAQVNPDTWAQIGAAAGGVTDTGTQNAASGGAAISDVALGLGGIADAVVQVVTYLLAVAIVIVGIWLYSRSNPQEITVTSPARAGGYP